MYPNEILPGIDLYVIMLCVAAVSAIVTYRLLADRRGLRAKLQNLCLFDAVASIVGGYYFAVLFQAVYNIEKNGGFKLDASTGATFYGGLIGGATLFLSIYFIAGRIMFGKGGEHVKEFFTITNIGAACVVIAHGFGRLGCLFAGCCHGAVTDAWYGIYMRGIGQKVVPVQLFEALFLFGLFALFLVRILKNKNYNLPIYMCAYGIWRFFIEYARTDYRGSTFISFLTPSQLTAILMVVGSVAVLLLEYFVRKKADEKQSAEEA